MKRAVFSVFLAVVCLSLDVGAIELSAETETIIEAIAAAHKVEIGAIKQGRGVALVSTSEKVQGQAEKKVDYRVHFMFNGIKTRSDVFLPDGNQAGEPHHIMAYNGEFNLRYNCFVNGVLIQPPQLGGFRNHLCEDFHPETFFLFSGVPAYTFAERLRTEAAGEVLLEIGKDGLIKISKKVSEKIKSGETSLVAQGTGYVVVDAQKGYRIVETYSEGKGFYGPGSEYLTHMRYDWSDYGSARYPRKVQYREVLAFPDRGPEFNKTVNTQVVIERFQPDVEVKDDEFTLVGMHMKPDTIIDDTIAGILYTYGSTKVDEETLKTLITNPEPSVNSRPVLHTKINSELKNKLTKTTDADTTEKGLGRTMTSPAVLNTKRVVLVTAVLLASGMCFWLFWKRKKSR